jgi:hypothetical protein
VILAGSWNLDNNKVDTDTDADMKVWEEYYHRLVVSWDEQYPKLKILFKLTRQAVRPGAEEKVEKAQAVDR